MLGTFDAHPFALRIESRQFDIRGRQRIVESSRETRHRLTVLLERDGQFMPILEDDAEIALFVVLDLEAVRNQFLSQLDDFHFALLARSVFPLEIVYSV